MRIGFTEGRAGAIGGAIYLFAAAVPYSAGKDASCGLCAKAGKPLMEVTVRDAHLMHNRIGLLEGGISEPNDFDSMGLRR